jgi:predicted Zn-dependent protease
MSFDEMKVDKYLHIVNFSDFQVDSFTGYFGGEIRLGFYHDGSTVIPVTGGSISGNITEVSGKLTFSTQMQKETGYEGPYALCIEKVTVAQ